MTLYQLLKDHGYDYDTIINFGDDPVSRLQNRALFIGALAGIDMSTDTMLTYQKIDYYMTTTVESVIDRLGFK